MIPEWLRVQVDVPVLKNPQTTPDGIKYWVRVFDYELNDWNADPDVSVYLPQVAMLDVVDGAYLPGVGHRERQRLSSGDTVYIYWLEGTK